MENPNLSRVFLACVEASSDAVMLTDTRGTISYVNDAWTRVYGYTKAESLGSTPRLLRSGHHDSEFYAKMWAAILDPAHGSWKGEVVNRAKDGREVTVLLNITPFRENGDPAIRGYFSIASDITEKKALEGQLLRQDRLVSIGLLASGLAHEIGTPLGVIRGRAEFLMEDPSVDSRERRHLEVIVKQADRISERVHALLNVARLGTGDAGAPVRVRTIVEEVESLAKQRLLLAGIHFENRVDEKTCVSAEPSRLEQVFLNLVINAIDAIEEARAKGRSEGHRIVISALRRRSRWEVTVEDTGCGIAAENLEHVFKPFFTTKDVGRGTGLGLSIVLQLVHGWGGDVRIESELDRRTVIRMTLPAA